VTATGWKIKAAKAMNNIAVNHFTTNITIERTISNDIHHDWINPQ
jgi:hypothetical protein